MTVPNELDHPGSQSERPGVLGGEAAAWALNWPGGVDGPLLGQLERGVSSRQVGSKQTGLRSCTRGGCGQRDVRAGTSGLGGLWASTLGKKVSVLRVGSTGSDCRQNVSFLLEQGRGHGPSGRAVRTKYQGRRPVFCSGVTWGLVFSSWFSCSHGSPSEASVLSQLVATQTFTLPSPTQCIVSVAGGATRAALTMHQARRNNMADVSAKDSSQVSSRNGRDGSASGQVTGGVWREAPECSWVPRTRSPSREL